MTGRRTLGGIAEAGYLFMLFVESLYWLVAGPFVRQPVRLTNVFAEMMKIGVLAVPIVTLLSFANGVIMAIQGIATLKTFGAESQVVPGIAYSVAREFVVLIAAIGFVAFGQRLDLPATLGMGLILSGILVIHLFSSTAPH